MLPILGADTAARAAIDMVLQRVGPDVCEVLADGGGRIVVLEPNQRFDEASAVLARMMCGVDGWPIPPAGLFVVEERTVYLRAVSEMTIGHELMHLTDCVLGGGVYLSNVDPRIRRMFASARGFVSPYAASACDEWWAESARAYFGFNDPGSLWPPVSPERLEERDPEMYRFVRKTFVETIPALAESIRARRAADAAMPRARGRKRAAA